MKTFLAVLFLATAATAANAQYVDRIGNYLTSPPSPYAAEDGRLIFNPSWSHILADGGREATAQETADWQAAQDAAAQAAANAQAAAEAAATLPLQSATGFAVQDSDGHWIELEPTGDGLPVIGVQISNSPLTPEERAAMKAERKAAHDALKAASQDKKLNDKAKVALLMKAVFGVEE